jgi:hypothetical protein
MQQQPTPLAELLRNIIAALAMSAVVVAGTVLVMMVRR